MRLLLDNTTLRADQFRDRFADSPYCEWDGAMETNYHFLMECDKFEDARARMEDSIYDAWENTRSSGNLSLTMEVIMGTCSVFNFSKELVEEIKRSFFQFLLDSNKKL